MNDLFSMNILNILIIELFVIGLYEFIVNNLLRKKEFKEYLDIHSYGNNKVGF
jgi:hypothetical protein